MGKKLLILRSEKIFFPWGAHIYRYLAEQFDKLDEFEELDKKYQDGKIKGALLLKKTFGTVLGGQKIGKVVEVFIPYIEEFLNPLLKPFLREVKSKGYRIAFFCSYPRTLFLEVNYRLELMVNPIYGIINKLDGEKRIIGIEQLKFHDEEFIKNEMEKLGFEGKFDTEPNRYGMLGKLIELMREEGFTKENTVLIGSSVTAEPQMKLAGKVIREFYDLNKVLKEVSN